MTCFKFNPVVFRDSFQTLEPYWEVYGDYEGNAGWGLRTQSQVSIDTTVPGSTDGSALKITAEMIDGVLNTSGLVLNEAVQTYGEYCVRVMTEDDPAKVTSGVVLLWPVADGGTTVAQGGEIDMYESFSNRDTRTPMESYLHWIDPVTMNDTFTGITHSGVDGSDWHEFCLLWTPDLIQVTVDGGTPQILSTNPDEIPDDDMRLTLQLDAWDSPDSPGDQPVLTQPVCMWVDEVTITPWP